MGETDRGTVELGEKGFDRGTNGRKRVRTVRRKQAIVDSEDRIVCPKSHRTRQ